MRTRARGYSSPDDFIRVRDFLKETFYAFGDPLNWGLERWNWARFHPSMFAGDDPSASAMNVRYFEDSIRIWELEDGSIAGLVNVEAPVPDGEFFIQRRPGQDRLLGEMLEYARSLPRPTGAALSIYAYERDETLKAALRSGGYAPRPDRESCWADMALSGTRRVPLPPGFRFSSMAEGLDTAERCRVQGLGFDHVDPSEWMTPREYAKVREAPDYRPELDLVTVAPGGEYASCCIAWYDDGNRAAFLEPVCTRPDFRRRGLGRAVVGEALRRAAELGAERAYVGSTQDFYVRVGFSMRLRSRLWERP